QKLNAPVSGHTRTFSLLFDMNQVFEGYVTQLYREIGLLHGLRVVAQGEGQGEHLLYAHSDLKKGGRRPHLKPDILLRGREFTKNDPPVAVLDTKWKLTALGEESVTDLYQLYAYAGQFGAPQNVLLYPWQGISNGQRIETKNLGFLHQHGLNGQPSTQSVISARLNVNRKLFDPIEREIVKRELFMLFPSRTDGTDERCKLGEAEYHSTESSLSSLP
ncbi:MAG TPA: hypothetical protein ENH10_10890, partial [Bacteroidetes bacterium]|nr:hypothetical protein [Bacteroidota bacterium]HEX05639.1 hypothetical protein [Bacteroidota bacterium]